MNLCNIFLSKFGITIFVHGWLANIFYLYHYVLLTNTRLTFQTLVTINVMCHIFIRNIESEIFDQLILTFVDQTWPAWCLISSLKLFSISEPSYNNITLTVIVPLKTTEWFMILWKFNPTRYKMQWSAWKRNLKDSY